VGEQDRADEQHKQILEQRKAEQQQKRQEPSEKETQERLDVCLRIVEEKGGTISRKQLIEILVNMLDRKRPTVSNYITAWVKEEKLFEDNNGMVYTSKEQLIPF
jgi:predicted transcriptional regulator YheO